MGEKGGRAILGPLPEAGTVLFRWPTVLETVMDHPSEHRSTAPQEADARAIRVMLGMTQVTFAATFGVPLTTLRDWEQGRSRPDRAARSYLLVIGRRPDAVRDALSSP